MSEIFNDDYATCAKTFARLRIYRNDLEPEKVTALLGLRPTESQKKGELWENGSTQKQYKLGGWFLSSEFSSESRDVRRHLHWLLGKIKSKEKQLKKLQHEGCRMDISCYWVSVSGHGGPTLSPKIMRELSDLNIEVWFDVYFFSDEERNTWPNPA
jgi:hypothetical protein